jgi:hypothetical protein
MFDKPGWSRQLLVCGVLLVAGGCADSSSPDAALDGDLRRSCGDGRCNSRETCSTCPADCGSCGPGVDGGDTAADLAAAPADGAAAPSADLSPLPQSCSAPSPPPQNGATYYVSPSGSDTSPGSAAQPFRTVQKAANVVNPGDTVVVEDGAYTKGASDSIVVISRGGSASNWVRFKSKNRWGARLDGQNNAASHGVVFDANVAYVRLEGFEISGLAGAGVSINAASVHDIEIVDNHIHHIGRICTDTPYGLDGIYYNAANVTIDGNVIDHIGRLHPGENGCNPSTQYYTNHDHGLYVDGANGSMIRNNVFHDQKSGWSIHVYSHPIDGANILNNTFAFDNPIILASAISNMRVENNLFYAPASDALHLYYASGTNVVLRSNLTSSASMFGGSLPAGYVADHNLTSSDPLPVDPAGGDFRLQAQSPAVDHGDALADVTRDRDGCPRPSGLGYDIGAYER